MGTPYEVNGYHLGHRQEKNKQVTQSEQNFNVFA